LTASHAVLKTVATPVNTSARLLNSATVFRASLRMALWEWPTQVFPTSRFATPSQRAHESLGSTSPRCVFQPMCTYVFHPADYLMFRPRRAPPSFSLGARTRCGTRSVATPQRLPSLAHFSCLGGHRMASSSEAGVLQHFNAAVDRELVHFPRTSGTQRHHRHR
jgi:hypothetical protein